MEYTNIDTLINLYNFCKNSYGKIKPFNSQAKFLRFILNYEHLFPQRADEDSTLSRWLHRPSSIPKSVKTVLGDYMYKNKQNSWDFNFLNQEQKIQLLKALCSKDNPAEDNSSSEGSVDNKLKIAFFHMIKKCIWGDSPLIPLTNPVVDPIPNFTPSHVTKPKTFIGRTTELAELEKVIFKHNHCIVSGIAGIGKTFFIKTFLSEHRMKYTDYCFITYQNNLETTIASIRFKDGLLSEKVAQQFKINWEYLLNKSYNSILVIDAMNCFENAFNQNIKKLSELPITIIVITRCPYKGKEFKTFHLDAMNSEQLITLFQNHCFWHSHSIEEITNFIHILEDNTLVIMLCAKYLQIKKITIPQLLENMNHIRLHNFKDKTTFSTPHERKPPSYYLTGNKNGSRTLREHIIKLYSLSFDVVSNQQLQQDLLNLSLFATIDTPVSLITKWFGEDIKNSIKELIFQGWIQYVNSDESNDPQIIMSTFIAEAIMGYEQINVKKAENLLDIFSGDISDVMVSPTAKTNPRYMIPMLFNVFQNLKEECNKRYQKKWSDFICQVLDYYLIYMDSIRAQTILDYIDSSSKINLSPSRIMSFKMRTALAESNFHRIYDIMQQSHTLYLETDILFYSWDFYKYLVLTELHNQKTLAPMMSKDLLQIFHKFIDNANSYASLVYNFGVPSYEYYYLVKSCNFLLNNPKYTIEHLYKSYQECPKDSIWRLLALSDIITYSCIAFIFRICTPKDLPFDCHELQKEMDDIFKIHTDLPLTAEFQASNANLFFNCSKGDRTSLIKELINIKNGMLVPFHSHNHESNEDLIKEISNTIKRLFL